MFFRDGGPSGPPFSFHHDRKRNEYERIANFVRHDYARSYDALVLDACNGRTHPNSSYGYHAVTSFSYVLGWLKGTATAQSGAAAVPMPKMTNNAGQSSDVRASSARPLLSNEGLSVY